VKRYVNETGSRSVRRLLASGEAATSRLSEVEVASALARRTREGDIAAADRDRALAALTNDVSGLHIVEPVAEVTALARSLLARHAIRAADALHLASCLYLQEQLGETLPFVAFDDRLRSAARAERLRVLPASRPRKQPSRSIGVASVRGQG